MERRIRLCEENLRPGAGSFEDCDYDMSRAFYDPGLGYGGYLKAPFKYKDAAWESSPRLDTVDRLRFPLRIGDSYEGRIIEEIRVEKVGDGWEWVLRLRD